MYLNRCVNIIGHQSKNSRMSPLCVDIFCLIYNFPQGIRLFNLMNHSVCGLCFSKNSTFCTFCHSSQYVSSTFTDTWFSQSLSLLSLALEQKPYWKKHQQKMTVQSDGDWENRSAVNAGPAYQLEFL